MTQDLVSRSLSLAEFPRIGKVVPEFNNELVRELSRYSYRILYKIKPDQLEVLAVIHKRRDLQADDILGAQ